MGLISENIFYKTYRQIRLDLPHYVWKNVLKNIPAYFFASLLDIFGLVIIFPIINLIISPDKISENKWLSWIYDLFSFESAYAFIASLLTFVLIIYIFKTILQYYVNRYLIRSFYVLAEKLSLTKYNQYMSLHYSDYINLNQSVLVRNTTQLPFELVTYIIIPFISGLIELLILFFIITIIVAYDFSLLIPLLLFSVPIFFIYNKLFRKKLHDASHRRDAENKNMYFYSSQSFNAFREIRLLDKHDFFENRFRHSVHHYSSSMGFINLLNFFSPRFVEIVAIFSVFAITLYGYLINKDLKALSDFLIVFTLGSYRIIPSLNKLILYMNYIKSSWHVFQYYRQNDEIPKAERAPAAADTAPLPFNESVVLRDLSFSFRKDLEILKNISLEIRKGSKIGIVGSTGAGKTTLLNILLRLHKETEGGIYCDGVRLTDSNASQWYKQIGYVPQNIILLDDSIRANITLGSPSESVNRQKLQEALKASMLEEFVSSLEDKENTLVGENGVKLSGGQRQRIGIARALYNGGKILIFDEATSSLDLETERSITESIRHFSNEYTVIIVAHRLQTLKFCEEIYRLENGHLSPTTLDL